MGNCVNDKNELEKSRESVLCFRGLRVSAWALGGGWRISRLAASPQTGRRSQTSARLASPATKIKQILWDKQIFENWIKHALPGLNMHKNCFVKVFFKRIYNFFYPSRAMRTNTFSKFSSNLAPNHTVSTWLIIDIKYAQQTVSQLSAEKKNIVYLQS